MTLPDQMVEAIAKQRQHWHAASQVDRAGWTDSQWIDDAEGLMKGPDGAITSLYNGHVMALLRRVRELEGTTS